MDPKKEIVTPDIFDRYHEEIEVVDLQFRSFGRRLAFAGPCVTVKCLEDNRIVAELAGRQGEGRVMVIDGGGSMRVAMMGDVLAERAMTNGWVGAVIHGVVRDSPQIDRLEFAIKALGTTCRRRTVELAGAVDVPVTFGGVTFRSGDWVYADVDAVVRSSRELPL